METDHAGIGPIAAECAAWRDLEADLQRAWDARARAAQAGDYAGAERWYDLTVVLGARLAEIDRATRAKHRATRLLD